jgi:hypothetical protein
MTPAWRVGYSPLLKKECVAKNYTPLQSCLEQTVNWSIVGSPIYWSSVWPMVHQLSAYIGLDLFQIERNLYSDQHQWYHEDKTSQVQLKTWKYFYFIFKSNTVVAWEENCCSVTQGKRRQGYRTYPNFSQSISTWKSNVKLTITMRVVHAVPRSGGGDVFSK